MGITRKVVFSHLFSRYLDSYLHLDSTWKLPRYWIRLALDIGRERTSYFVIREKIQLENEIGTGLKTVKNREYRRFSGFHHVYALYE